MPRTILVLGATGLLGRPAALALAEKGHHVRALARSPKKARTMLGDAVEILAGSAGDPATLKTAMTGCNAVHINLPQTVELEAVEHVLKLASGMDLERISYVSATTAREENRWFHLIDVKLRAEEMLRSSGHPRRMVRDAKT